jgi:CheY-like chemotaxis protein
MKTVLIIDDEFSIIDSMTEFLTWAGYRVSSACNGQEGLEQLAQTRPDVVVLDYMMPVMDGVAMLRLMRADPAYAAIPVLLVTAAPRALPRVRRQWNAMLAKPFDVDLLLATIARLIGK